MHLLLTVAMWAGISGVAIAAARLFIGGYSRIAVSDEVESVEYRAAQRALVQIVKTMGLIHKYRERDESVVPHPSEFRSEMRGRLLEETRRLADTVSVLGEGFEGRIKHLSRAVESDRKVDSHWLELEYMHRELTEIERFPQGVVRYASLVTFAGQCMTVAAGGFILRSLWTISFAASR